MPHCAITSKVLDVAAHYEDKWEWQCSLKDLDPATEFKNWLQQQVPTLPDVLVPGALTIARAEIQAMRLAAQPIPAPVSQTIGTLLAPFTSAGTAKFNTNDLSNVRIISNTNTLAKPYLRDGFGAITLHDVVVVNASDYNAIMAITNAYTSTQLAAGLTDATADKLLLLVHELVHVHQYAQLGFNTFVNTYLLEAIVQSYPDISKEVEAYQFELAVAKTIGGAQTSELRAVKSTMTALGNTLRQTASLQEGLKLLALFKACQAKRLPNCLPSSALAVRKGITVAPPQTKYQAVFAKLPSGAVMKMPIGGPPTVKPKPLPMPGRGVTVPITDPRISQ